MIERMTSTCEHFLPGCDVMWRRLHEETKPDDARMMTPMKWSCAVLDRPPTSLISTRACDSTVPRCRQLVIKPSLSARRHTDIDIAHGMQWAGLQHCVFPISITAPDQFREATRDASEWISPDCRYQRFIFNPLKTEPIFNVVEEGKGMEVVNTLRFSS